MFTIYHIIAQSSEPGYIITDGMQMAVKTNLQGT